MNPFRTAGGRATSRRAIICRVAGVGASATLSACGPTTGSKEVDLSVIDEDTLDATGSIGSEEEVYFDLETFEEISKEEWEEKYGSTDKPVKVKPVEMDLTHPAELYENRRDPQHTRELAEGERGDLRRGFTTYTAEVSSPREFIKLWAEDLDGWLNAGCTPEEVEPYLALDGDGVAQAEAEQDYLQAMHEKYDFEIYKAMTGDNSMSYAMFDIYCSAHQGVLRRYLSNARKNKNLRETAVVTVKNHEITESLRGDVDYIAMTDIQITNTVDHDPSRAVYKIDGRVGLKVSTEGSTIISSLITDSDFDITKPFKSLSKLS